MGEKAGSFRVLDAEKLRRLYKKAVFEYDVPISLMERQPETCCIIGDVDFKFPVTLDPVRKYTTETHVCGVIQIYQDLFRELFRVDEENLDAFVFERDDPYIGQGAVKDGFHFMFLGVVADKQAKTLIHTLAAKRVAESKLFEDLNIKNAADAIDTAVVRVNWFMYGASKPNLPAYAATHIVNSSGQVVDADRSHETAFVELFSIDKPWEATPLRDGVNVDRMLADVRDSVGHRRGVRGVGAARSSGEAGERRGKKTIPRYFEEVTALMHMLAMERADSYAAWLEVGFCLHDVDRGYLPLWVEFSKRSPKYRAGECEQKWASFKSGYWNVGSLHWWAKEDNPRAYAEFMIKQTDPVVEESIASAIAGTSYDVAKVVHKRFQWDFVCSSIQFGAWFYFDDIRWRPLDRGVVLRENLSNSIFKQYCRMSSYLTDLAAETQDGEDAGNEKDNLLRKAKTCNDVARKLRTRRFKTDVMADCADLFIDSDFMAKVDENHYLLGFDDGIFDLEAMVFRKSRPSDYITKSTRQYFPGGDNAVDEADVKFIENIIEQILPDPEVREYFMTWAASTLDGHAQQMFLICTGNGSNGKSLLLNFLKDTVGEYACTLPVSLITNKRAASNSATPEIARTKGCRLAICQEPESNAVLNAGLIKELTGCDEILGRELYKPIVPMKPQIQMVMMCNDMPHIQDTDGGIWRRITVIPFDSKFTNDEALLKRKHHYPRDDYLDENLAKLRPAMLTILLRYYKTYKDGGRKLVAPSKVCAKTKKYRNTSDVYAEFINERLEVHAKEVMNIVQLYTIFKQWFRDMSTDKIPSRTDLRSYLDKYYADVKRRNGWTFRLKFDDDDDDDADADATDLDTKVTEPILIGH
jgi:P4 family phage/plasmid primase-like protien